MKMTESIDAIMESASQALVRMEYLVCEELCLRALGLAEAAGDWVMYARILLPLQESRRQRRMIAAEGAIRLGTRRLGGEPAAWLDEHRCCCVTLTPPHGEADARALVAAARQRQLHAEALLAVRCGENIWTLRSFTGPAVTCDVPAPPTVWMEHWLAPAERIGTLTPADWFIDAGENLGNAALATVTAPVGDPRRVDELRRCLDVVTDHEILHQQLWQAAQALRGQP